MPHTVQEFGALQHQNYADRQTCLQFVDEVIQYVRNYRHSSLSPLLRFDGSQSFSLFGCMFLRFVTSELHLEIAQEIANAVAECRDIPRNERPIPILQFLANHRPLLERASHAHCYLFLAYLCKLCLKLEDEGLPFFTQTAVAFGKFLIGSHPNCHRYFLFMRSQE